MPQVSVLITSYNREKFIAEAIESILASTYQDFELIIVDDASTDNTVPIARSYTERDKRIKIVVNDSNLGDYPNRNKAASFATGKYIKYVDSDDRISPEGLQLMVEAMENYPEAAFAFSDVNANKHEHYPVLYSGEAALRKHFFSGGLLLAGPASTIIRLKAFKNIFGFSGKRYVSDYEAWLNLCLSYSAIVLKPGLMWIRTHHDQENEVGKLEYYHLNYNLHKAFIKNASNPFSNKERAILLYNYKILLGRRVYQRLLKWYGIKKTWDVVEKCGENWFIFIAAFLPVKR